MNDEKKDERVVAAFTAKDLGVKLWVVGHSGRKYDIYRVTGWVIYEGGGCLPLVLDKTEGIMYPVDVDADPSSIGYIPGFVKSKKKARRVIEKCKLDDKLEDDEEPEYK
jgi:hypothetical protein